MLSHRKRPAERLSWIVAGVTGLVVIVIASALAFQEKTRFAAVFATPQDCLRAYDDATCKVLVAEALRIHFSAAPQYSEASTCELAFGEGGCMDVPQDQRRLGRYVPTLIAILAPDSRSEDFSGIVPLYAGQMSRRRNDTAPRKVYFAGTEVGLMSSQRYGGAAITQVRDRSGQPITANRLAKIRGNRQAR